jgi:ubiquinone biosynthesis protein COQ4
MASTEYEFSPESTRNPLRYALAVWRLVRNDPSTMVEEAAIVQMGFSRSRLGRRFARWEEVVETLKADPRTAAAMRERKPFGPIVVERLLQRPEGSLGRVFAEHCRTAGIDPNLVHVPTTDDVGWMLNHMYQTHDIWHVLTGWGTDLPGEVGVAAFYSAQFGSPPFFGYNVALIFLNVVMRKADLGQIFEAFSVGYQTGQRAEPLFGMDWDALWDVPIEELRTRFNINPAEIVGEGIQVAA